MANKKDLVEVFGYAPDDPSSVARSLWQIGACPFTNSPCIKYNHDQSIVYGTCSVTSPHGDLPICPNRFYFNGYSVLQDVAQKASLNLPFHTYQSFVANRHNVADCLVLLGHNSGKEVKLGRSLSMDWIIARICNGRLVEHIGVEIQSIDITGNYRDAWHGYANLQHNSQNPIPSSAHGLNWANVHKRLIPQLIRKGLMFSRSKLAKNGLFFVVPEIVYQKFEEVVGSDIPILDRPSATSLSVVTYQLGEKVSHGNQRSLAEVRHLTFEVEEFANRFISGASLPTGQELDDAVRRTLGVK